MGELWSERQEFIIDNVPDIVRSNMSGGYIEPLKEMLKHEFNLNDKQLNKLYHHSTSINAIRILDKLPVNPEADKQIQNLRNPIVVTALFELRKLVNGLIETH